MRALIVDDSRTMRAVLREALEARGHSTEAFSEAEPALAAFQREPAELLVIDWVLQGMDGLELCRRVRACAGGADAVILMITSRDQPEHLAQVLDAGASDYVAKPFDRALLETRLTVAERRAAELGRRRVAEANQKLLEARLQTSQRLAATGTIAAGMAHEINNPLAAITANLDFIGAELAALPGGAGAERLHDIQAALSDMRDAAKRVARIVDDLKTFSRADDDRMVPVEVGGVIDAALGVASNQIRHRARLVTDVLPAPPVLANESRLGQVFLNLFLNAVEAIRVGDADHNEIRVASRGDGSHVIVEVSDTGCGIAPELRGRIFDAFFTTKPVGEGMGLGLSVCNAIVSSFGGTIELDSEPGRGSTFRVRLPASTERQTLHTVPAPPPSMLAPARPRLLLVDDEPTILRSLLRLLRDYDCTVAKSGREALEVVESGAVFELILCDVMMPELTGMELYEALVARKDALHERVVFMTGGAFTPRAREFLDSVPNERLDKPFDADQVRTLVRARTGV